MDMVSKSLFLVGEIGGNDYNLPLFYGVPFEKIRTFTPSIIAKISSTIAVSHSKLLVLLLSLSPVLLLSPNSRNGADVHR